VSVFKFIHAADLHLDSPLVGLARYPGAPADNIRGSTRRALTNLVDLAIAEEVAFVVIAGDLFDGAGRDYHTALFVGAEASRLRGAGIPVVIASGNHDAASILTKQLRPPDNVKIFGTGKATSIVLENVPVVIHGQGFARRELFDNLAAGYPAPHAGLLNIGLLHTSVDGREGHAGYAPCTLAELLSKGYDYWALGHIHSRETLSEDPWIVFSGCTQGRHINETGAKGATLVSVDGDAISTVEHRDLDVLRWAQVRIDAAQAADEDDLFALVHDAVETVTAEADGRFVALRIFIEGETELHRILVSERERMINEFRAIVSDAGLGQAWLERVKFETRAPADVTRLLARDDAIGGLLRTLRSLPNDQVALKSLSAELEDLKRKLPDDVADDFDLTDASVIGRLVGDVEHLLLPRLTGVDA
jgi:DNA repair protein SbcD/Mre11